MKLVRDDAHGEGRSAIWVATRVPVTDSDGNVAVAYALGDFEFRRLTTSSGPSVLHSSASKPCTSTRLKRRGEEDLMADGFRGRSVSRSGLGREAWVNERAAPGKIFGAC